MITGAATEDRKGEKCYFSIEECWFCIETCWIYHEIDPPPPGGFEGLFDGNTVGAEGWIGEDCVKEFGFPPAKDTQVSVENYCVLCRVSGILWCFMPFLCRFYAVFTVYYGVLCRSLCVAYRRCMTHCADLGPRKSWRQCTLLYRNEDSSKRKRRFFT